ncbi:ATP-binding protein [Piscinibacter sp.]|uniref:ATP-binding protein n=1 Tax=Piscinibacter sp. TaxID=1903157 RepID=UPI002C1A94BE|nr:ATP-binding protein [Albitalea sp.]HUG24660.1 ATP-binding protein [Albitalea sp.]
MTSRVIPLQGLAGDATRRAASAAGATPSGLPAAPRTPEDTGLPLLLQCELLLKVMQQHGLQHLQDLATHLKLGVALTETLFTHLRRDQLVEVRRRGALEGDVIYDLTQAGRGRAAEVLARNLYSGPAPVPLAEYTARVRAQSVAGMGVTRERLAQTLADVVMRPELRDQLGAAMNSRRAILLYGPPGAGKTFLCGQMARLLAGPVAVPHAIEVGGEIIRLFDPLVHRALTPDATPATLDIRQRGDDRWVLCERPVVVTGGELTLEMLDLTFDPRAGYYHAPPHFKANNGLFLVDDLGRQLVTPRQLLNRWLLPMEQRHDYLMLRNGSKFQIPFDALLFFSTNLSPAEVADEAFLRRIGYKIFVGEVEADDYRRIAREVCAQYGVPYSDEAVDRLVTHYHHRHARPLLACTPRDMVSQIAEYAAYRGDAPRLTPEVIDWAWHNHFASQTGGALHPEGTS